jgi:hypothetical protein
MKPITVSVAIIAALLAWQSPAAAQSTEITTDYLMTLFAPLERFPIDNSTVVVNVTAGGRVNGPRINGRIIPPGGDWLSIMPSGARRLDVRLLIETDDGAVIYMTYNGIYVTSEEVAAALARGEVVTHRMVPYFMTAPTFQTSSEKYAWLNNIQAVGKMIELKSGEGSYIKYDVFIVR